ncbi:MAG: excalibur calcium-binding domain-containing protein [Bifidobacterium longum]
MHQILDNRNLNILAWPNGDNIVHMERAVSSRGMVSSQSRTYECSSQKIRKAIDSLLESRRYSPTYLVGEGGDIGIRTSSGCELSVSVRGHEVVAKLVIENEDTHGTLDVFFRDLTRKIQRMEAMQDSPQQIKTIEERPDLSGLETADASLDKGADESGTRLPSIGILNASGHIVKEVSAPSIAVITACLILLIWLPSFLIGWHGGYASRNPTEQPEYTEMVNSYDDEIKRFKETVSNLKATVNSGQAQIDELKPYKDEYDQKKAELDQRQSDLDNRSAELDSRENTLKQQEDAAAAASTSTNSGSSYSSDGSSNGWAYYKNCSAARAAGAAPLYRGQPGYRSALDRDGDGIACEWH